MQVRYNLAAAVRGLQPVVKLTLPSGKIGAIILLII